jgi:hypothetical protein
MGRQDVCRDTTHNTTIFYVYMKQKFWHQHWGTESLYNHDQAV